ncbi:hypothetical protein Nepgr_021687 [Nepenthes gracilis]|uniref:Uncharacterized protein n=1 Tax=Nepenthes gracilis TaxID=150966 RepID=A0AAD3XXM1_NEPGR|nr:hypothetical protein Nepgr_021687 [Nepenthes gracilis]
MFRVGFLGSLRPIASRPTKLFLLGAFPPVKAVKGSGVKDPLSSTSNSVNLGQTTGPMPTPTPSKANFSSLADYDLILVDGIRPSACNEPNETNNLEGDSLKLSISKSETFGSIVNAALDSNSFAALTNPEADTLLSPSAGSGISETNYPVEPAPIFILTGGVLVPPSETPLVVDCSCISQNLPSGEPLLHNEVQLDEVPSGPPSSIPTHPRSSHSARRVPIESVQSLEIRDVGPCRILFFAHCSTPRFPTAKAEAAASYPLPNAIKNCISYINLKISMRFSRWHLHPEWHPAGTELNCSPTSRTEMFSRQSCR